MPCGPVAQRRLVKPRNLANRFLFSLLLRMSDIKSKAAIGFLTVIPDAEHGLFGGYLVLNRAGRPLEFHCTAPVKPNRAQEILYGPTLEPYLFGEQIGLTLIRKATREVLAICTDRQPVLAVREFVSLPVAMVLPPHTEEQPSGPEAAEPGNGIAIRMDQAHRSNRLITFALGGNRLAVPAATESDKDLIAERLGPIAEGLDLLEPFQRIREAIEEARRGGASS